MHAGAPIGRRWQPVKARRWVIRSDGVSTEGGDDDRSVFAHRNVGAVGERDACRACRHLAYLDHRVHVDVRRRFIGIQVKHNPFRHVSESTNRSWRSRTREGHETAFAPGAWQGRLGDGCHSVERPSITRPNAYAVEQTALMAYRRLSLRSAVVHVTAAAGDVSRGTRSRGQGAPIKGDLTVTLRSARLQTRRI